MTTTTLQSFYVEQVRTVTVICFTVSALDEGNYEAISDELLELVTLVTSSEPIEIVVELSAVRRIDDLGLAMLQAFHDSIEEAGGTAILCRVSANVMNAIGQAGLRCEFNVRETRGEALWSF